MTNSSTHHRHTFRIAIAITLLAIALLASVANAENPTPAFIQVNISVDKNLINLQSAQDITVEILSTIDFDATTINISSVQFESAPAKKTGNTEFDVNGDGLTDIRLHFNLESTAIQCGDSRLVYLTGKTNNGTDIVGSAIINIKDCTISPPGSPNIISFDPPSPVMNNVSESRTFNISVNQTVNVYWYINGTLVRSDNYVSESEYTNNSASLGIWNITAVAYNSSTALYDVQYWDWIVGRANTTTNITSDSPDPSVVGQPYTVSFTVNTQSGEIPTGNVVVSDGTDSCTASVAAGSCSVTSTTAGIKMLNATYSGDANFSGSSGTAAHQVDKADQTITFGALDDKAYGDSPFTVSATASSELPVSFTASGACTVSGSTVTITGAGSCTVTAHQTGDDNYNAAPDVPQTFNTNKAQATITLKDLVHTYDGTPKLATATTYPEGLTGILITYDGSSTPPTNVGSYAVVANLTNSNYEAPDAIGTLVINKADQIITFGLLSDKIFSDVPFLVSATASSGLPVSFTASGACTVSGDTVTITGAGSCTVTAHQAGDSNYNAAPDVPQTFSINKAQATITLKDLIHTYDGAPKSATVATDPEGLTIVSITYDSSPMPPINAGSYAVIANLTNANYEAPNATDTLIINKASQTISFDTLVDKAYGDIPFLVSATASSGLPVSFTASGACTVSGDIVTITGAGSCTVTAHQAGDENYNAAPDVPQTFSINKATATITLKDLTQTYDGTPKSATATTDPEGLTDVSITYDGSPTAPTGAGSYAVIATLANDSYQATPTSGTLIINKADQTITFSPLSDKIYGDASFYVNAIASSGLSVSFTASGDCSVSGDTVTITEVGICTITAHQAGDENYNAAPEVPQTFSINKATATITLSDFTHTYDRTQKSVTVATNPGELNGVSLTYNDSSTAPTDAGNYAIVATLMNDNYQATPASGTLVIEKADQIINFGVLDDKIYGDSSFTVSATASSGLPVSFTASGACTVSSDTVTITGADICTITAHQAGDENYNAAPEVPQTFSINKATATITLSSLIQMYDGTPKAATVTTNPQGLTGVSITYNGSSMAPTDIGNYTVVANLINDNYQATPASGTLAINKADQTITTSSYEGISTGGSGCGRNVNSKENLSNIKQYEYSREVDVHILKGTAVFRFATLGIVNEAGFTAKTNEGCITARGELLKERPSQATSDAPGTGTIYFNVWVGPLGYSESPKVEDQYIVFSMNDKENNGSAKLMIYKDNSWIDLRTEKIGTDTYKAYTGGFGSFAIVEIPKTASEVLTQPVTVAPLPVTNGYAPQKRMNWALLIIVFVVIASIIIIYRKRQMGLSRKK